MGQVVQLKQGNHGETVHKGRKFIRGANGLTILDGEAEPEDSGPRGHWANLASRMSASERRALAERLNEYIQVDEESRAPWKRMEEIGLALMGQSEYGREVADYAADVDSPGLAQVKLPLQIEASTHFQARAIAEIFPAEGPVKTQILGKQTKERVEQAERIRNFGNYYLTQVDKGYYADTDQMLLYLPLAGSAFRKAGINWATGLPELRYVKATNFIVPYSATDLQSAPRYTHVYTMTGQEVRRAMEAKRFINVPLQKPALNEAKHPRTADISDSRHPSEHDDDALYDIAEMHLWMECEVDKNGRPSEPDGSWALLHYVVVFERTNQEILLIKRNYEPIKKGHAVTKIEWFVQHKFFPGLGFYGWGYTHTVGSLAKAANDGVNALLDSAYAANFQGGFVTKEGRAIGVAGELQLEHGKWKPLDGTYEEIAKALYTPPFHEPSQALAKLTELLIDCYRRFGSTTEAAVGDANNTGPVGTTIALIEQSNIVPTGVHKRLHVSMGHELQMWARLVQMYMPSRYDYEQNEEERYLLRKDFDAGVDVIPVSDPNISSQTQRIAMCQGVLQLQAEGQDLYSPAERVEAHRRMMQAMRVPDFEAVAPKLKTPKYLDPVGEFQMIMGGMPVRAFETQDHGAHLAAHQNQRQFLQGMPGFMMMSPERQQLILSAFDAHEADHMALLYRRMVIAATGMQLPPPDEKGEPAELPPEIEMELTARIVPMLPPPPPPVNQGEDPLAKTKADVEAKKMLSEAQLVRETQAFQAQQVREQKAFEAEERRKDDAASAEIVRQGAKAKLQLQAGAATTGQKLSAADLAAQQKLQHTDAGARQKLQHTEAGTGQKLRHTEATQTQSLRHKDAAASQDRANKQIGAQQDRGNKNAAAVQDRDIRGKAAELERKNKEAGASADRDNKGKAAAQDRRLAASKSQQEQKFTEVKHEQGVRHTEEDHRQAVKILEEDHAIETQHKEEDHKRESKMAEQTGKLKISQAKEQARAKKGKTAKKKAKK